MQRGVNIHKMKEDLLYIFTAINIYQVKIFIYGDSNSISKNFDIGVLKLKCFDNYLVLIIEHIQQNVIKVIIIILN